MNLPQLLRRLQVMAAARDERGTRDTLDAINDRPGWKRDLKDFVSRMADSERSFLEDFFDQPGDPFLGRGGSPDQSGIPMGLLGAGAMSSVSRDSSSLIYCPATLAEMAATLVAAGIGSGNPSLIWGFQEVSGNIVDLSGNGFTGTASGTISYQQPVSGWTRLGVSTGDGVGGSVLNTSVSLPDLSTTSMLTLAYVNITSAGATRAFMQMANTTVMHGEVTAAGLPRILVGAVPAVGASDVRGQVRPFVLKHDVTGSAQALYTNQEKIVPTFTALSGKTLRALESTVAPPAAQTVYLASFFGPAAELSDAQVRTLLQTLNWTVAW